MRRRKLFIGLVIAAAVLAALVPVFVAEGAVHALRLRRPDVSYADGVTKETGAGWKPLQVTAQDGARLDGWLFTPKSPNGSAVMLLHGVNDSRLGVMGHAVYLLRAGFTVLAPDSRGQGASGGTLMTYGLREASDVHAWAETLFRDPSIHRLYGLGASMGAAILIQSLPREPRFRAIVADSPFDTFEDIACYRIQQVSGLGRWASWPTAQAGLFYVRWRYRLNLEEASPAAVISKVETPILLIHGLDDTNIPPVQSRRLHAINPRTTSLWLVPGAAHIAASSVRPQEYVRRVLDWFGK